MAVQTPQNYKLTFIKLYYSMITPLNTKKTIEMAFYI